MGPHPGDSRLMADLMALLADEGTSPGTVGGALLTAVHWRDARPLLTPCQLKVNGRLEQEEFARLWGRLVHCQVPACSLCVPFSKYQRGTRPAGVWGVRRKSYPALPSGGLAFCSGRLHAPLEDTRRCLSKWQGEGCSRRWKERG